MKDIILISISRDELKEILKEVIREEVSTKREKELLSSKEICAFLSISPSGLHKLKREGKLPFKKLGKRIFFNRADVLAALKDSGNYQKLKLLEQQ